ncbi:response regulator [Zavarzinia sp. CC-PAN008]|uniref:response regulator n=1 Tax=Zavarzinia sp. CC-PAN008 TaxID=3243332 RepID=UPI003F748FC9
MSVTDVLTECRLQDCVMIVEDEFLIAQGLAIQVEDMGLDVCATAASADEAIDMAVRYRPAIVLMDVRLRGARDGVDAAIAIHESLGSKVIFITGSREPATQARIAQDHPAAVLFKPVSDRQLRTAIQRVRGHA